MKRKAGVLWAGAFWGLWALAGDTVNETRQMIHGVKQKAEVERFYEVARIYEEGRGGVPVDLPVALHWYTRALREAGHQEAQKDIKRLNEKLKIFNNLKNEALSGEAHSQYLLGMHYALGVMVPSQGDKALYWLKQAMEQGYGPSAPAYKVLREKYQKDEVFEGLVKKALAGEADSQFYLAYAYETGMWGKRDFYQALYWYREALLQGHGGARQREGLLKDSPYVQAALNQSCLKKFQ